MKNQKDLKLIQQDNRSFYVTLIICLIVFLGAIALLINSFNRLISTHDQHLSGEICTLVSEKMNNSINSMTESTRDISLILSAQGFDSPKDIYKTLKEYPKSNFLSIGFIDSDGVMYATIEERVEFEKWNLMETASMADPVSISIPYRSTVYGQSVITIFSRIEYANSKQGYMFLTYLFKDLQDIAETESLLNDIEIMLMHAESANIIQCVGGDKHASGSWANAYLSMQTVNKSDKEAYINWLNRMLNGESNIGLSYSVGKTFYSQYCSDIPGMPGWYVVVRIPSNALSATMKSFRNYVLIFLAVLLITVIVLITNMYRLTQRENRMLEQLSIHDPLTKVFNRRAFDFAAENLLARNKECALIFFDIDFFKQVNDQFGHDAGDQLLVLFSDAIKKIFGEHGIVSRFGGDEFVVLTEMPSVEKITQMLNKATDDVHNIKLDNENYTDRDFMISFSAGSARFPSDADNLSNLKKCADTALYETKENGRNGYMWFHNLSEAAKANAGSNKKAQNPSENMTIHVKNSLSKNSSCDRNNNSVTINKEIREAGDSISANGTPKKVVKKIIRKKVIRKKIVKPKE
ncbi:MAG: sensor domain-containing diguanylate cyclase [Lachnospiraceae bacterium]|nr:sensor domain-containing diguanylate cyclase [Lachnospiraceae bacterium]